MIYLIYKTNARIFNDAVTDGFQGFDKKHMSSSMQINQAHSEESAKINKAKILRQTNKKLAEYNTAVG